MFSKKSAIWRFFLWPWKDEQILSPGNFCTSTIPGGRILQGARTAVQICLLCFSTCQIAAATSLPANSCSNKPFDEIATVRYIHDGDTLHLSNGKKIRLIGINTPELARDNKPAEAFAIEAKNAIKSLFKQDKSIALIFGKDKKDRYGRYLAHTFLSDGSNVQAAILQKGLASTITIPPNIRFATCYSEIEKSARCNKTGIWKNTHVLEAKNLSKHHTGFHLIKGNVKNIKTNKKGIWLNLDNKLTVGIRPKDQKSFDLKSVNNMLNQKIIVRGWLNKSNKSTPFYLRVRHPLSIQSSTAFSCN